MRAYICRTCGVQHAASARVPDTCAICLDERQFVGPQGQQWVSLDELREEGHRTELREEEPGLTGLGVTPQLGIGQRGLIVSTAEGNILWDCVGYIDDEAVAAIQGLGGLAGITASHPHFYGAMVEYSRAFGGAPIYVSTDDREWVMRADPAIRFWRGDAQLPGGLRLIQVGGHFPGSAVLHWPAGAGGRGALLVGDTATVVANRCRVSFMFSYPNLLPLPEAPVRHIAARLAGVAFDRVYGGWWGAVIPAGGAAAVQRSAERYVQLLRGSV